MRIGIAGFEHQGVFETGPGLSGLPRLFQILPKLL